MQLRLGHKVNMNKKESCTSLRQIKLSESVHRFTFAIE
jgi:hypothetical protein